jgi:hypothetical protein
LVMPRLQLCAHNEIALGLLNVLGKSWGGSSASN